MWKYYNPVEVVFGTGKLDELGQLMAERGLDRALIVSDPFTHRSGVAARLKECAGGRVLDIISEVEPNPTCDNVDACARRAREPAARWAGARCSPTTPPTPKSPFSAVPCSPGWPWWTRC